MTTARRRREINGRNSAENPSTSLTRNGQAQAQYQNPQLDSQEFLAGENGSKTGKPRDLKLIASDTSSAPTRHGLSAQALPFRPSVKKDSAVAAKASITDPRTFQLNQIRRRFSPKEITEDTDGSTIFVFALHPSDPDFPFELSQGLQCRLHVPARYGATNESGEVMAPMDTSSRPRLQVTNSEMDVQWRESIQRGFDGLLQRQSTLLHVMNRLDRDLEALLTEKIEEPKKINANRPSRDGGDSKQPVLASSRREDAKNISVTFVQPSKVPTPSETQRDKEIRQLKSRFGQLVGFNESRDNRGDVFIIPLILNDRHRLPESVRNVDRCRLLVPFNYPRTSASVENINVEPSTASRNVQLNLERKARVKTDMTLINLWDMLATEFYDFAQEPAGEESKDVDLYKPSTIIAKPSQNGSEPSASRVLIKSEDLRMTGRPPEWDISENGDSLHSETDDSSESDPDEHDDEARKNGNEGSTDVSQPPAERGISLTLGNLELYSIELLEVSSLSIAIKCLRCKNIMDVNRLRPNAETTGGRREACKKCATVLGVSFRPEMMHANAIRAGYLDLDGCTVVDLLASNFIPTCSTCSTPYPRPGISAVRGASSMAICRQDHTKMSMKINEAKFQLASISYRAEAAAGLPRKKKKPETLGVTVGEALPRQGRCRHYGKSFRWFRFSCCDKVYPCDRCHDESVDHPCERAHRMLCGFCSREQNFRPEDCGICHLSLMKRASKGGFWEGGQGTRDPARMSRKDPRKYKRRPGGTAKKH